jgi:hypothetical protein
MHVAGPRGIKVDGRVCSVLGDHYLCVSHIPRLDERSRMMKICGLDRHVIRIKHSMPGAVKRLLLLREIGFPKLTY